MSFASLIGNSIDSSSINFPALLHTKTLFGRYMCKYAYLAIVNTNPLYSGQHYHISYPSTVWQLNITTMAPNIEPFSFQKKVLNILRTVRCYSSVTEEVSFHIAFNGPSSLTEHKSWECCNSTDPESLAPLQPKTRRHTFGARILL